VAAAAGISRRTFFRLFSGKQEILSSDHDVYFAEVIDYLSRHESDRSMARAARALELVLEGFLAVPSESRERYRLTRSHPSLRSEELRWVARYQSTIAAFLTRCGDSSVSMTAEVQAAALVAAHNKALRSWLRAPDGPTPIPVFRDALKFIGDTSGPSGTRRIAVIETALSVDDIVERLGSSGPDRDPGPSETS